MQGRKSAWMALALLVAACGPMGGGEARDDEAGEARAGDVHRVETAPDKGAASMPMPEAPVEAALAGDWALDGSVIGRVDEGGYRIFDYSQTFYEDGVVDFMGRIEATDGEESASFGLGGVGTWTRSGDRIQMRLGEITVTPEQRGADYREAAEILATAIREQPSVSYDIVELDATTLRLRNISNGTVESYTRP